MRSLVIGSGAREEALCWALSRCGTAFIWPRRHLPWAESLTGELNQLTAEDFDLVVIGPEAYLADGTADQLRAQGLAVFGPGQEGARLETDKAFARACADRWGLPSPWWMSCQNPKELNSALDRSAGHYVVKEAGLAGGKGVLVTRDRDEALTFGLKALDQGKTLVVEEWLDGLEISAIALIDESGFQLLPLSQDHKRAFDEDQGPNTGGMGALATPPWADDRLREKIEREIFVPALAGLKADGIAYRGALYAGLMVKGDSIKLLVFNARFGDPETEALMPLMGEDFGESLLACAQGRVAQKPLSTRAGHCCCVVVASANYPTGKDEPEAITLKDLDADTLLFYSAADRQTQRSGSGRNVIVSCRGATAQEAVTKARQEAGKVCFKGARYRQDIGKKALEERP